MDEKPPSFVNKRIAAFKAGYKNPRTYLILALMVAGGVAAAFVARQIYLKPMLAVAQTRFQSNVALLRLYDLQKAYYVAHASYANDLDTLLASAADGAQLREKLKASVDINTLVVAGNAQRFRLEANVLDPERTSVKLSGPREQR